MKKVLFVAAVLMGSFISNAQTTTTTTTKTDVTTTDKKADDVIKVNTESFNFGKIKQSVPVSTYFELTNTTNKPVVVESAWGSCGCTTPEVPKEPIAPGTTTKLKVNYNAAAMGNFNKDVYIKLAGITQPKTVKITGEVLDATKYDEYTQNLKTTENAKIANDQKNSKTKTKSTTTKTKSKEKASK